MPTTASNTYGDSFGSPSQRPELVFYERFQVTASTTLDPAAKKFIAVAVVTATGKLVAYNDGGAGGAEICRGFVNCKVVSDASGKLIFNGGSVIQQTDDTVEVFKTGIYDPTQITGLDAAALVDLGARYLWGVITAGEIIIPG